MGIEVRTDFSGLDAKFSHRNLVNARKLAANDALQAMNANFVPLLHTDSNANLRSMSSINSDGSQITWTAVYAKAQFYGFVGKQPHRVHHYTTPGTSKRWDLRLKGRDDLMKKVTDTFVKEVGLNG